MFIRRLCLNRNLLKDPYGRVSSKLFGRAKSTEADSEAPLGAAGSKYKVFRDEDSEVVLDVVEERLKYQNWIETESEQHDQFVGLNLQRKFHMCPAQQCGIRMFSDRWRFWGFRY